MTTIYITSTITDSRARVKKKQFEALGLKHNIGVIRLADCYTIDAKLEPKQIEKAKTLLANPVTQKAETTPYTLHPKPFSYAIEIGFLPGVTDNVGHTAKETLADGAKIKFEPGQNVYSSQAFFVYFKKNNRKQSAVASAKADILKISQSLYNPLIQRATIFTPLSPLSPITPIVKIKASNKVAAINLNIADDELIKLGKLGIPEAADKSARYKVARPFMGLRRGPLALSLEELKAIRDYFNSLKRKPTDVELETLAQTWSEHCKHTIFSDPMDELKNGIYKTYIKAATEAVRKQKGKNDFCVSVFTDNAGGIKFDSQNIIAHKVETHNTPSALDPFGGSITGIVGVNRDAIGFGLGSKPVANFFGFCLANPENKTKLFRDKNLEQPMLSARRIMDGVIAGINAGGNQSGIPTPSGFLYFDDRYRGKPLVFAGTLGLIPKKIGGRNGWQKQAKPGDFIVMVGGRVGVDGIHGATFSSEGLDTHSPATAVQIGDPITQKKLSDAICKEARDQELYTSITDCGAGGLSSAVAEMAKESGGCLVNLDKVPLKYPGLSPWQIWISESQERMVLAVPPKKWKKFETLMKARGVEATVIGQFTNDEKCTVKYNGKIVLNLDMEFLHDGRPKKQLITKRSAPIHGPSKLPINRHTTNLTSYILNLISSPNITSTEFISTQYDHEVQGSSIQKPLQGKGRVNSEASVIRPVLNSKKAVVMSYGLNPMLSEIDPYAMAANSIDDAIRSAVSAGANVDYLALLDNFCWCSPSDPKRLWQLKEAARACFETAVDFGTPFISGKDSMHNDFKGYGADGKPLKISIPPTLLISAISVIPDFEKTVSLDAKIAGDLVYILGEMSSPSFSKIRRSLGEGGQKRGPGGVPVDAQKNLKLYRTFYTAVQNNLVASAISVNRGGIAAALCKTLIGGGLGGEVNLAGDSLFTECSGRILVTVAPQNVEKFEHLISENTFTKIGKITKNPVMIIKDEKGKSIVKLNINQALKEYKSTFKDY